MKHSEVIELNKKISRVYGLVGFEINYCIKKNLQDLKKAVQPLIEMEAEIAKILEPFQNDFNALRESFATVNGVVKFKKEGNKKLYDVPEDKISDLENELEKLKQKHKELFEKSDAEWEKYNTFLKEKDSDFVITQIDASAVQRDITTEQMNLIFDLIK